MTENSQYWKRLPVGTLLRVRDEDAEKIVNKKEATYAPKSEWKELRNQENFSKKSLELIKKIRKFCKKKENFEKQKRNIKKEKKINSKENKEKKNRRNK